MSPTTAEAPPDKGVMADAGHLVDGGKAAERDVVADLDMTAERGDIGHGDVVADDAVMRDVRIGEEIAVVADRRLAAAGSRCRDAW